MVVAKNVTVKGTPKIHAPSSKHLIQKHTEEKGNEITYTFLVLKRGDMA
jgi:hypothetical protein